MDAAARSFLESVTQRTLHAHNFSRSSSEASHVLSDLLARYYTLLASTCARYAEHAGRSSAIVTDAIRALDELGTSVDDLTEFVEGDGRELQRYATSTARRAEELNALKESLSEGLKVDRDDLIHLVYERVPTPVFEETEDESEDESSEMEVEMNVTAEDGVSHPNGHAEQNGRTRPRSVSPALPPSPISPPPSPARKRARMSGWKSNSHIPGFLPPYPSSTPPPSPKAKVEQTPDDMQLGLQNRSITPPPQLASSTTASDYLTEVPYSMSALAQVNETHLPEIPDALKLVTTSAVKRNLPGTQQSLVHAYHYVLTNPPPPQLAVNPQRHKVAMSLLTQMYTSPRWTATDTLYANLSPPRPRVVAPAPSYPVPNNAPLDTEKGKENKVLVPPQASRSVVASETIIPLSAQPMSRIPEVLRQVLSPALYSRATKLAPPALQVSGANERFIYGAGVPAPWNSNSSGGPTAAEGSGKNKDPANGGKEGSSKGEKDDVIPDSTLYATWDWDMKDFRQPIAHSKNRRAGSFSIGGGVPNGLNHRPSISIRAGSAGAESSSLRKGSKLVIRGDGKAK